MKRILSIPFVAMVAAGFAGCGEFEVRSIVLDLRILAATVDPPEIVTPFDPQNPTDVQLQDVEVCALLADPADSRQLEFSLTACAPTDTFRCDDPSLTAIEIASATVEDPETAATPVSVCGTLAANSSLLAVLNEAVEGDRFSGFGGIPVQVEILAKPVGAPIEDAEFAAKQMLYSPQIPPERVANTNPSIDELSVAMPPDTAVAPASLGRCKDVTPIAVDAGQTIQFLPVETAGARETYLLPTFDGGSRQFTENLTYSWYASAGRWQREVTGGNKDPAGNEPELDSNWIAPTDAAQIGTGLDVEIWLVQQDERGGLAWYQTCVRVNP